MADEEWQRSYVERVLQLHNETHGTAIELVGRYTDVHGQPEQGQKNPDWVAKDTGTGDEVAIEVKRLTDAALHEQTSLLEAICREVAEAVSGELSGTFIWSMNVSDLVALDLRRDGRMLLRDALRDVIATRSRDMALGDEVDLTGDLQGKLSDRLPHDFWVTLRKWKEDGSFLNPDAVNQFYNGHTHALSGKAFDQFNKNVKDADDQLEEAKRRGATSTFLILLTTGYMGAEADAVQATVEMLEMNDYDSIDYCYVHGGNSALDGNGTWDISEIALPRNGGAR